MIELSVLGPIQLRGADGDELYSIQAWSLRGCEPFTRLVTPH